MVGLGTTGVLVNVTVPVGSAAVGVALKVRVAVGVE
jgi:hypothetical protein